MRLVVSLLLLPALLLVSCGGDDDDDPSVVSDATTSTAAGDGGGGGSDVACPDEGTIGDIAGAASKAPDETELPDGIQCTYSVEDAANGVYGVVNIRLYSEDAAGALDTFKAVVDDEEQLDIAVGDEAWWAPSVTNLFVVHKGIGADILLSGLGDGDDAKAIAIALAKPALA